MKHLVLYLIFPLLLFQSCNKQVISEQGSIDVITSVYFNASKNLDDYKQFYVSKINYKDGRIIEFCPNLEFPEIVDSVYYIKDSLYYHIGTPEDAKSLLFFTKEKEYKAKPISAKQLGAKWVNIPIYNYDKRKELTDTVLYNKRNYSRFEIQTDDSYAIYYVYKTDTIIPYSLNPIADKEYKGRIERIDSYDKTKDIFTTIVIIPKNQLDEEAMQIFQYNDEIENNYKSS